MADFSVEQLYWQKLLDELKSAVNNEGIIAALEDIAKKNGDANKEIIDALKEISKTGKEQAQKWNLCENATEYEVFSAFEPEDANADPNFKRLAKTEHLYYYITNAEAGKTYLFKVRGITHYRQGEFSGVVEVSID